jgi:hypothetical protein
MTVVGKIICKGVLKIYGLVEGELIASNALIADGAQIHGDIVAQELSVGGRVKGNIHALRVKLQSTAIVEGDIFHRSLSIDFLRRSQCLGRGPPLPPRASPCRCGRRRRWRPHHSGRARRLTDKQCSRFGLMSACGRRPGKNFLTFLQHWSGAVMCPRQRRGPILWRKHSASGRPAQAMNSNARIFWWQSAACRVRQIDPARSVRPPCAGGLPTCDRRIGSDTGHCTDSRQGRPRSQSSRAGRVASQGAGARAAEASCSRTSWRSDKPYASRGHAFARDDPQDARRRARAGRTSSAGRVP